MAVTHFFLAMSILNYAEAPLLKAGIYFVSVTLEQAGSLIPPLVDFYRSRGPLLLHTLILGIGKSKILQKDFQNSIIQIIFLI